jgi:hypothetical protein
MPNQEYRAGDKVTIRCLICGNPRTIFANNMHRAKYCSDKCGAKGKASLANPAEFLACINKLDNGCWIWTGGKHRAGYGAYHGIQAHRYSYTIHQGAIPDGLWVLHNCPAGDNPSCVNPEHLYLGTVLDNNRDTHRKGRGNPPWLGKKRPESDIRRGSQVSKDRTEAEVLEIRRLAMDGVRPKELMDRFCISRAALWNITIRNTWKHI